MMRTRLGTQIILPQLGLFLFSLVLIQSPGVLQQRTIVRSSTEAEYHAIAAVAVELQWVKSLLSELLAPMQLLPTLFSDNLGVTYLFANPVFQSRMKHLAIDYHFIRDLVQWSELGVVHVSVGD